MRPVQRPPTLGIAAAIGYVAVVFAPYVLLPDVDSATLALYYDFGVAGPQFLSLLAVVSIVLFAAGREGRTEPDLVAGITIVLGAVLTMLVTLWAFSVPEDLILSIGEATWIEYHRWLVVATAAAVVAASVWYAKALELF